MAAQTTPKGMSSRLLTMKFMQRAASSSSPTSNASTPISDEASSKRRKLSHSHPAKYDIESLVDRRAIQAAIDEGERKREEALEKHAAELGDARWVLDVKSLSNSAAALPRPLQVVQVGYAEIDSSEAPEDVTESANDTYGRAPPIRRYNMSKKKVAMGGSDSDDDTSDGSPDDSDSSNTNLTTDEGGSDSRISSVDRRIATPKGGYSTKRSAENTRAKQFADKRRKKDVKLNHKSQPSGLSSISSGGGMTSLSSGGRPVQRQSGAFSFSCHNCGEVGHKAADCKKSKLRSR